MGKREAQLIKEFVKEALTEVRIRTDHPTWAKLRRWFHENVLGMDWGDREPLVSGTGAVVESFVKSLNKNRKKMISREQTEKIYEYAKRVLETYKRSSERVEKRELEKKLLSLLERKFGDLRFGVE